MRAFLIERNLSKIEFKNYSVIMLVLNLVCIKRMVGMEVIGIAHKCLALGALQMPVERHMCYCAHVE